MKLGHFLDWLLAQHHGVAFGVLFALVVVGVIVLYAFGRHDPES